MNPGFGSFGFKVRQSLEDIHVVPLASRRVTAVYEMLEQHALNRLKDRFHGLGFGAPGLGWGLGQL